MKVGFMLLQDPLAGGIYQYSATMLSALESLAEDGALEGIVVFADDPSTVPTRWPVVPSEPPTSARLPRAAASRLLALAPRAGGMIRRYRYRRSVQWNDGGTEVHGHRPRLEAWYRQHGVDLMIFPSPSPRGFESGVPYVMAIHDLQHRLQPSFPEVSADGVWESREYTFGYGAQYAAVVLVDSETGKEDVLHAYGHRGVAPEAVCVLPFLPAVGNSLAAKEELPSSVCEPFVLYPAQFWPHKNHRRIVEALGMLKGAGIDVHAVFTGSHGGKLRTQTHRDVMAEAARLGVTQRIHDLGYVPEGHLASLYVHAVALVMPTFFGPTNIPVLEAWTFGCPVVTSDIRGIREQVRDAGLLIDPQSPTSIAHAIRRLLEEPELRRGLVQRGHDQLRSYTYSDFKARLKVALDRARVRSGIG